MIRNVAFLVNLHLTLSRHDSDPVVSHYYISLAEGGGYQNDIEEFLCVDSLIGSRVSPEM